jgi:microcystin-dependent protein
MSKTISNFKYNSTPIEIKSIIPVGTIVLFGGLSSNIPSNWHICDGTTLSASTYSDLYTVITNKYGGNSSNFNIPDLVDKYVQATSSSVDSSNYSSGSNTMVVDNIPSHTHTFSSTTTNSVTVSVTGRIYSTNVAGANSMSGGGPETTHWSSSTGNLDIPVTGGSHTHTIYHTASTVGSSSSESVSLGITHTKLYYIIKITV